MAKKKKAKKLGKKSMKRTKGGATFSMGTPEPKRTTESLSFNFSKIKYNG